MESTKYLLLCFAALQIWHEMRVNFSFRQFVSHETSTHFSEEYLIGHSSFYVGDSDDMQYPRDLDIIQSTPLESTLSLRTPPRVLTLNERPFDFHEMEQAISASQPSGEVSGTDLI